MRTWIPWRFVKRVAEGKIEGRRTKRWCDALDLNVCRRWWHRGGSPETGVNTNTIIGGCALPRRKPPRSRPRAIRPPARAIISLIAASHSGQSGAGGSRSLRAKWGRRAGVFGGDSCSCNAYPLLARPGQRLAPLPNRD